jgi:hypothetical protein
MPRQRIFREAAGAARLRQSPAMRRHPAVAAALELAGCARASARRPPASRRLRATSRRGILSISEV